MEVRRFEGDKTFRRVYNYDTCGIIKTWEKRVTTLNDFLTAAEAATALGLHQQTIKRFCRIGKLQSYKVNSGWLIPKTEVESFASTYEETRGRPANGRAQRNEESEERPVAQEDRLS